MKKTLMMLAVGTLVMAVGFAAYAHYEDSFRGRGMMNGSRGGGMMYGPQSGGYGPQNGTTYGNGPRGGMMRGGRGGGWNNSGNGTCRYGGGTGRWNGPQQQETAVPEMLSEDTVKETALEYLGKYLSGYSIDTVEKDAWRPLYVVTVKG
ncbi:MAG: hypothetical protein GY801_04640, partial [bacterium]|nr:hypothetical protein [bacterium]